CRAAPGLGQVAAERLEALLERGLLRTDRLELRRPTRSGLTTGGLPAGAGLSRLLALPLRSAPPLTLLALALIARPLPALLTGPALVPRLALLAGLHLLAGLLALLPRVLPL